MSTKTVLLSHSERNKIVKIPQDKEMSDIEYLENEFRKCFSYEGNVSIAVSFHKFSLEWDDYIELDSDELVNDKDKLKVVVTPWMITPAPSSKSLDDSYMECHEQLVTTPSSKSPEELTVDSSQSTPSVMSHSHSVRSGDSQQSHSRRLLDEDDIDAGPSEPAHQKILKRAHLLDESSGSEDEHHLGDGKNSAEGSLGSSSVSDVPKKKRRAIVKSKEDSIPLPDPFPLPQHYSAEVEAGLKAKKISNTARIAFTNKVASAMLCYKRYPTKDDYDNVTRTIVQKYPFMKAPVGSPTGHIDESLRSVFREFRRDKVKKRKKSSTPKTTSEKPRPPGKGISLLPPEIPPGEDDLSFERHNNFLKKEHSKVRPNAQVVRELMSTTFPMRRADILASACDVQTLFKKYPFLNDVTQIMEDMKMIVGDATWLNAAQLKWDAVRKKICEQAGVEADHKSRLRELLENEGKDGMEELLALAVLPYLLPDVRSTPDSEKVLYFTNGATNVKLIVQERQQAEPYGIVVGTTGDPSQAFLVVDCHVIGEVELNKIPLVLLAAYFVFNICYCKGCYNMYSYLEVLCLDANASKISPTVKHLITALHNL